MKSSSFIESWVRRYRRFMARRRYSRFALKTYSIVVRSFLHYLEARDIDPTTAQPSHICSYLAVQHVRYMRRNGREPLDAGDWRSHHTSPIHLLFRLAQGQWPPPSEIGSRIASFRTHLKAEGRTSHGITAYRIIARRFLQFLARRSLAVERVQPSDVRAYIKDELRYYRRRHGREPRDLVIWRCGPTPTVHALLRLVQGQWPPTPTHPWYERFRIHMEATCPRPRTRGHYVFAAGQFLVYLERENIPIEGVQPAHLETYRRFKLAEYRRRHGCLPERLDWWRRNINAPIHRLLRLVHGEWPPSQPEPLLAKFRESLVPAGYTPDTKACLERIVRHFLIYLRSRGISPEEVRPVHVESYIQSRLTHSCRRHGHRPKHLRQWRRGLLDPISRFLRLAQGCWPPPGPPGSPREQFCRMVLEGYGRWLTELHGFARPTLVKNRHAARVFLDWLGERATRASLRRITVRDLDAFFAWRNPPLRRATRRGAAQCLRSFLRYLHAEGLLERDLAPTVSGPKLYWNEGIPSAMTEAQVSAVLAVSRKDTSPIGRRDYAILLLLATYGLRSGEVVRLRLDDIDWRREQIHVRRSKGGGESTLPLRPAVGSAILRYLQHGRPAWDCREVFLRGRAPQGSLGSSALYRILQQRLSEAGVRVEGKHGPHALRYARAVSLLRADVPLKTISDILGHRAPASTDGYLKLATADLRRIGLELPREVLP